MRTAYDKIPILFKWALFIFSLLIAIVCSGEIFNYTMKHAEYLHGNSIFDLAKLAIYYVFAPIIYSVFIFSTVLFVAPKYKNTILMILLALSLVLAMSIPIDNALTARDKENWYKKECAGREVEDMKVRQVYICKDKYRIMNMFEPIMPDGTVVEREKITHYPKFYYYEEGGWKDWAFIYRENQKEQTIALILFIFYTAILAWSFKKNITVQK